jgi:4-amino-4-deoxy-L-arabinose transferase-like glycosyltransferase
MTDLRVPRKIEAGALIAIVLIAIIFRCAAFNQVPPGLHYDEAIDAKLAQEIRSGVWPIYSEEGWGREPLYHYLVALTLSVIADPTSALRAVSGMLGLIQLLAAYFLFRKLFGVPTALIGAAWIAVLFWTVSTSRAGLRNITLTTLATFTALAFWWALAKMEGQRDGGIEGNAVVTPRASRFTPHVLRFTLAGILLGLTLYTYQPSRVVPLIYVLFVAYLFWRERDLLKQNWRAFVIFFAAALLVALPLGWFLLTHPGAETQRAFQTEPIRALLQGDVSKAAETALATLKMFTVEGDPQILYNLTGRPLFIGLGSLLFVIGLLVSVFRFKRPTYAFMLIWLVVTLLPNMLTAPAPFFYRAIATQTPVAVMPAIATVALGTWLTSALARGGRKSAERIGVGVTVLLAVLSVGQTALTTWRDYFDVWGDSKEVRFQYSAAYAEIAAALKASAAASPVGVSGYFIEDADPIIFEQALNRSDILVRWFDARESLIAAERLALPSQTPLGAELTARFGDQLEPIAQSRDAAIYSFAADRFRVQIAAWSCAVCPTRFNDQIELTGVEHPDRFSRAAKVLPILTAWHVLTESAPGSTAIFVHLLDANDQIVAQDDRLGVPRHTWQTGDDFVQVHRLNVENVPPGKYRLTLGLYNRADGGRWAATDRSGQPWGDRIIIGEIEVTP